MPANPPKLRVLVSATYNPWFNIATEDWIFREMDPSYQTLYLWQNEKTVVIGRSQNPWSECNLKKMEDDGVYLARRASGGGAVFHDLGNICFTFLSPKQGYDRAANGAIMIAALKRFGITAELSGRNDIVVPSETEGPRKVSGSAFREAHDRAFHHGTMLISSDLTKLSNYLTPNPKKLESKGRASVRSRVMNLVELAPELTKDLLYQAIIEEFFKFHGGTCEIETLDHSKLTLMPQLQERFAFYGDWNWRFGKTPEFHQTMTEYLSWGLVEVHLDSEKGHITRAQVFSDSLFPDLIDAIQKALHAKPYTRAGVHEALQEVRSAHQEHTAALNELEVWLKKEVEA